MHRRGTAPEAQLRRKGHEGIPTQRSGRSHQHRSGRDGGFSTRALEPVTSTTIGNAAGPDRSQCQGDDAAKRPARSPSLRGPRRKESSQLAATPRSWASVRHGTRLIDAGGRRVIPGLNDNHMHLVRGALLYNLELRWDGVASLQRGLEMIAAQADTHTPLTSGFASWADGLPSSLPKSGCRPSRS